jgi:hypothetical protein
MSETHEEKVVIEITNEVKEEVQEVVNDVVSGATTALSEEVKDIPNRIGLKLISESDLTNEQKKLAENIYDTTKANVKSFISDLSINNTIKITKTIGQVVKELENVKIDGKSPSGSDKKIVAIQLGRILIKEVTPDDKGEAEILMAYDLLAEPTLEAMIEVSKVVNVVVHEMATKCCPSLLELFKKIRK